MKLPLTGGAYKTRSVNMNTETMINLFLDHRGMGQDPALVGTPGTQLFKELDDGTGSAKQGAVRGMLFDGTQLWVVVADWLLHINLTTGTQTRVGGGPPPAIPGTGRVSMAHNGTVNGQEVIIATGSTTNAMKYSWKGATPTTGTLSTLLFGGAGFNANTVTFIDGRFVLDYQNTRGQFIYSNLYTTALMSALNFATAEGSPDALVAVYADKRELYLFGEETIEIWYTTADPNRVYARFQGGFVQTGCVAPLSVARVGNTIMWLGRNERGWGQVMRFGNNYLPEVVSPPGINYQLSKLVNANTAHADVIQYEGHEWYVLTFPNASGSTPVTWVYDATMDNWFQWRTGGTAVFRHCGMSMVGIPAIGLIPAESILIGDYRGGATYSKIYLLNSTAYTDYEAAPIAINRERTCWHANAENDRTRISRVQLDCEEGDSGSVTLDYSKDGGQTFGTARAVSTGATNSARVLWRQLGSARNWVFRLKTAMTTGPVIWLNLWGKLWGERER